MNKFTKQCVAAFASLAMAGTLCVAGAVVANNVAFATGADQTAAKPAPWSEAGKSLKGKIIINKKDASNNNNPLEGATFTIQKVTLIKSDNDANGLSVDLTSEDGWTKLAAKVKQLNTTPLDESKLTLDKAKEKTTGKDGKAEFDTLDLGLYLVKEKSAPTGYTTDVKPFFMTVPEITREAKDKNNTYTYDVSVSPKNTNVKNNVTKTADNGKIVGAGDTLPYTITATVNKKKSDAANSKTGITKDEIQGFAIYDDAVTAAYDSVATNVVKEVKIVGQAKAL
ncbi:peptidase, partial [Bifidobacteriaceae bacterium VN003]